MGKKNNGIFALVKATLKEFGDDNAVNLAAGLAYYTLLSLPATLIILISILGLFLEKGEVKDTLYSQSQNILGENAAKQILVMIENAGAQGDNELMAIVGVAVLIFVATILFNMLQLSLNIVWRVRPKPEKGWVKLIRDRLLSFFMIILIGFLLFLFMLIQTLLSLLQDILLTSIPDISRYLILGLNILVTLGIVTLLFAMIYRYLPDARIRWREVWTGAFVTAVLFMVGRYLIGFYLEMADINSTYGAAGSVVVILVWLYYSSILLFLGAEFTQVYARRHGKQIMPVSYAVRIKREEVEK